jgi:small-conductance mechanosensitive channel
MDFLTSVGQAILDALTMLWDKLVAYLPNLIAAIIILIIGILIAKAVEKLVQKIVEAIKVDDLIKKINVIKKIEEAGTKVVFSQILAWMVKWFLYIVLLVAVSEILQLGQFTDFLKSVALYLPNVIIAVLILVVGLILGSFMEDLIVKILISVKAKLAALIARIAKWAIVIFAVLAALTQLNVAPYLINTLFTTIAFAIALAAALAFGLGGKDAAKDLIDTIKKDINQ